MSEEKRTIPRLRKKHRTWADVDPESLTAALWHQELSAARDLASDPAAGTTHDQPGEGPGQLMPAGQRRERQSTH